jgi:hypothetical protein
LKCSTIVAIAYGRKKPKKSAARYSIVMTLYLALKCSTIVAIADNPANAKSGRKKPKKKATRYSIFKTPKP